MGSTNYLDTFIAVAQLQHAMLAEDPYEHTSDDVLFEVHAIRTGLPEAGRAVARQAFFARDQACLRASPLGKRHGWGLHHDAAGRVAIVAVDSDRYAALLADDTLTQRAAMRSRRL